MPDRTKDPRYPYTYANDYIRGLAGYNGDSMYGGMKLSRSDAGRIREKMAEVMGVDDEELAKKLADIEYDSVSTLFPSVPRR